MLSPEVPRSRAGNAIELPHARPGRIIGPHGAMGDLWHVPGTKDLRMGTKDHYRAWMAWMACNHRIHERFLQGFTGALICHDLHSEFSGLSWLKLKCIDPYKCTMVSRFPGLIFCPIHLKAIAWLQGFTFLLCSTWTDDEKWHETKSYI